MDCRIKSGNDGLMHRRRGRRSLKGALEES
jgi:hypothetical protein